MTYNLKSHYFECSLDKIVPQSLLRYEKEMGFEPRWVTASEALEVNLKNTNASRLRFLDRNIYLLKKLKENSL